MNTQGKPVSITGKLSPFRPSGRIGIPDQPVLITMHNEPDQFWCVVFSTEEALHAAMKFCDIKDYKIKQVQDGKDFAESVLEGKQVRLMLDPQIISREKTRWTEIVLE